MTKVTIRVPELNWRKQTMEVPQSKTEVVKEALRAQQDRITHRLTQRNEEIARKLDEATRAQSKSGRAAKWILLGVGAAVGAGVGFLLAPMRGRETRARVAQKAGKYARTAGEQTARQARYVGGTVGGKTQGIRSRVSGDGEQDLEPGTITDRVQTELGEDRVIGALPRLNVNTEYGGVVYLRGVVPSESERERAEKVAKKQRGVTQVVNELQLGGAEFQHSSGGSDAVQ